jgi:hypothetical protein
MSRTRRPKLSPAERAHLIVLAQEARRERLERLLERQLLSDSIYEQAMRGESHYVPRCLHHHGTQWECAELDRINANRPAARICFCLPASAYEGRRHAC